MIIAFLPVIKFTLLNWLSFMADYATDDRQAQSYNFRNADKSKKPNTI